MIGFYAPYTHGEATAMALSLAELTWEVGSEPLVVASGPKSSCVRSEWDARVQTAHRLDPQEWLGRCSHVVWFGLQPQLVARARRIKRPNILVPLWQQLRMEDRDQLLEYDAIACPSHACYRWLRDEWQLPQARLVEWSLPAPICQRAVQTEEGYRLLLPIGPALKHQLAKWIYALEILLDRYPGWQLTILQSKPGTRAEADVLQAFRQRFTSRVKILRGNGYEARQAQYAKHDWLLWPAVADHSSHFALEAIHSGLAVVSLDIPPHTLSLLPGVCSRLIPSDRLHNLDNVPQAQPSITQLVDGLQHVLGQIGQPPAVQALQAADWQPLRDRQTAFRQSWLQLWDLVPQPA